MIEYRGGSECMLTSNDKKLSRGERERAMLGLKGFSHLKTAVAS